MVQYFQWMFWRHAIDGEIECIFYANMGLATVTWDMATDTIRPSIFTPQKDELSKGGDK